MFRGEHSSVMVKFFPIQILGQGFKPFCKPYIGPPLLTSARLSPDAKDSIISQLGYKLVLHETMFPFIQRFLRLILSH